MQSEAYQNLVNQGQQAEQAQDVEEAILAYEQAYSEEQTFEVNQKLASLYLKHEQYEAAMQLVREQTGAYFTADGQAQQIYLACCLAANVFIEARQLVAHNPELQDKIPEIEAAEAKYRTEQQATLKENQKAFYHLSDNPMGFQSQVIKAAMKLPLEEFMFSAKSILIDPFAHQLTRVSVLEELIKLQINEAVEMKNLIGETEQVIPAEILPFEQQPVVIEILNRLEQSPLASDPSQFIVLKQQFTLCLMLLMPDFSAAISDVQTWMEQTLKMFGMEFMTQREETQAQQAWREQLSEALMAL
ncbi:hypothetical protein JOC36_001723 [Weissella uvarum]|uniref:hypothetical protein n=1 Tax=Weissella uvarum TaxID=1479233 RepID=UPI00196003E5|nr:hypothetical protein [Weissella uvarum]MBM7618121.1 hypothetical protein [Weissella uvarum]MCM0595137.1 hypothetical protein [Weissella uvarum]